MSYSAGSTTAVSEASEKRCIEDMVVEKVLDSLVVNGTIQRCSGYDALEAWLRVVENVRIMMKVNTAFNMRIKNYKI